MAITMREFRDDELGAIHPLISQLNGGMTRERFDQLLARMRPLGYRCVGAYDGERLVGLCGFWDRVQFWNAASLQLDNLVVDEACRNRGIGEQLMAWVEAKAREEGRQMLVLDSYAENRRSHRFYFRQGYDIRGYHFAKDLG